MTEDQLRTFIKAMADTMRKALDVRDKRIAALEVRTNGAASAERTLELNAALQKRIAGLEMRLEILEAIQSSMTELLK